MKQKTNKEVVKMNAAETIEKMKIALSCSTLTEMANMFNVSPQTIIKWKQRNSIPKRYLEKICEIANMSYNEFINISIHLGSTKIRTKSYVLDTNVILQDITNIFKLSDNGSNIIVIQIS